MKMTIDPIEKHYAFLNEKKFCEIDYKDLEINQYIRYYNKKTGRLPFAVIRRIMPSRLEVQAFRGSRKWFVQRDTRFFTPIQKEKRFEKKKSK